MYSLKTENYNKDPGSSTELKRMQIYKDEASSFD